MFATFTTDGVDGPVDAAGAIVNGTTVECGASEASIHRIAPTDTIPADPAAGDLFCADPTRPKPGDIRCVLRT